MRHTEHDEDNLRCLWLESSLQHIRTGSALFNKQILTSADQRMNRTEVGSSWCCYKHRQWRHQTRV